MALPPAGGNANDYVQWALSIDNVASAWCFPIARGLGTVDVVILANEETTGAEIPSDHDDLTGTATSVVSDQLVDSSATFISDGVSVGDVVRNTTASTSTTVSAVTSETELTLEADIFSTAGHAYEVVSLCNQVLEYIDGVRPVTASSVQVVGPTEQMQDIAMTVTGDGVDLTRIADDITDYLGTMIPGQVLYRSQLIRIALDNGSQNAVVSTPSDDVTPSGYNMLRPGTTSVT